MVDFEQAEHNGVRNTWGEDVLIRGCYFHVKQACCTHWKDCIGARHWKSWDALMETVEEMSNTLDRNQLNALMRRFYDQTQNPSTPLEAPKDALAKFGGYVMRQWFDASILPRWTLALLDRTLLLTCPALVRCKTNNYSERGMRSIKDCFEHSQFSIFVSAQKLCDLMHSYHLQRDVDPDAFAFAASTPSVNQKAPMKSNEFALLMTTLNNSPVPQVSVLAGGIFLFPLFWREAFFLLACPSSCFLDVQQMHLSHNITF